MRQIFIILFLGSFLNGYSQQKKDSTVIEWTWKGKRVSEKEWSDSMYVFTRRYIDSIYSNKRSKNKN